MPNNWKTYTLDEICNRITDGSHSSPKEVKNGNYQIATVKDMNDYGFYLEQCKRISDKDFESLKNQDCVPEKGDVLFSKDGTIGKVLLFDFDYKIGVLSSIAIFRPKEELIDSLFLSYYLKEQTNNNFIKDNFRSGSAIPRIILRDFKKYNLTVPELSEQKSIAAILSTIDDKIENNLAINQTLEEMAMALYKHCFVDFGPFQDGEFIESELGRIPKGWEVKQLEELVDVGSSKRIFYNEYVEAGIPFYRGKEVIELSKGKSISSELFITIEKFQEIKSKFEVPKKGDILISSVGTIGVSWLVDGFEDFYFKDGNLTWLKNYKTFIKGEYLHLWLNSENGKKQIDGEVIGSTQKALTISSLRNFKILFPSQSVYKQIGEEFENYYEQRQLNLIEIKTLTQLRDTLLPKLISGEVRLKEFRESITN